MTKPAPGTKPRDPSLERAVEEALKLKGPTYRPRARHLLDDGSPAYTNRLILETSPYLLQHAHNPVDWWPWCEQAFQLARREDKPVFQSVGYSTCHWCHVMESECFEDEEIARLLNEHFVSIKVDREERPDIDSIYMSSVQAVTGSGGWPMSVWLNHRMEPFYGGTYFPKEDSRMGPGLESLLRRINELWEGERFTLDKQAEQLVMLLKADLDLGPNIHDGLPGSAPILEAASYYEKVFDRDWGGFGGAPKFPRSEVIRFLLRYHRRTGDREALEAATRTLEAIRAGGIHDHIGGGFCRYSVDREWLVPHFEKMLYDNALLCVAYLEAHQLTGDQQFADVVRDIVDYVAREMTSPDGAFHSGTDADS
ncbi:MAG: thioredoxin domain-containing protein, partial [Myxococcota bacterium]